MPIKPGVGDGALAVFCPVGAGPWSDSMGCWPGAQREAASRPARALAPGRLKCLAGVGQGAFGGLQQRCQVQHQADLDRQDRGPGRRLLREGAQASRGAIENARSQRKPSNLRVSDVRVMKLLPRPPTGLVASVPADAPVALRVGVGPPQYGTGPAIRAIPPVPHPSEWDRWGLVSLPLRGAPLAWFGHPGGRHGPKTP